MQMTKLIYLENFTLLQDQAIVIEIHDADDQVTILLDQTIFYPQGGGQPYDQGTIENEHGKFLVEQVRFVDGFVHHIGKFETGSFVVGQTVDLKVNAERRDLHSRLHSAGHVVDMAMVQLQLNVIPAKAYHFPDGPSVEYKTSEKITLDKEKLKQEIEVACNQFIAENRVTQLLFMSKNDIKSVCHHVPDFLPENKPARVVMYGDFGVPCGGTHVMQLQDIGQMVIRKIKQDSDSIRVCYDVVR